VLPRCPARFARCAQVAAQAYLFLLAGYETTASTLAFTLYLLAGHPDAEARLLEELDAVVGRQRAPGYADMSMVGRQTDIQMLGRQRAPGYADMSTGGETDRHTNVSPLPRVSTLWRLADRRTDGRTDGTFLWTTDGQPWAGVSGVGQFIMQQWMPATLHHACQPFDARKSKRCSDKSTPPSHVSSMFKQFY
jgi:Cytochrome P450